MPDLRQLIDLNYVSMSMVTVLVFGVVSLGIACAFVIFIMKHLREYGIMKAMGVTAGEMMRLIIMEITAHEPCGILCGHSCRHSCGAACGLQRESILRRSPRTTGILPCQA